jgi:hypothetical protein
LLQHYLPLLQITKAGYLMLNTGMVRGKLKKPGLHVDFAEGRKCRSLLPLFRNPTAHNNRFLAQNQATNG